MIEIRAGKKNIMFDTNEVNKKEVNKDNQHNKTKEIIYCLVSFIIGSILAVLVCVAYNVVNGK